MKRKELFEHKDVFKGVISNEIGRATGPFDGWLVRMLNKYSGMNVEVVISKRTGRGIEIEESSKYEQLAVF